MFPHTLINQFISNWKLPNLRKSGALKSDNSDGFIVLASKTTKSLIAIGHFRYWVRQILGPNARDKLKRMPGKCFSSRRSPPGLNIWLMDHFAQQLARLDFNENFMLYMGQSTMIF